MITTSSFPSINIQSLINKFEANANFNGAVKRGGKTFTRIATPPQTRNFLKNEMPVMQDSPRRSVREMVANLQTRIAVSRPVGPPRPASRTASINQPIKTSSKPSAQVKERIMERKDNSAPPAPDPGKKVMTSNPEALAMAVRFGAIGNPLFKGVTESNMPSGRDVTNLTGRKKA
jgi:hypothetical protein